MTKNIAIITSFIILIGCTFNKPDTLNDIDKKAIYSFVQKLFHYYEVGSFDSLYLNLDKQTQERFTKLKVIEKQKEWFDHSYRYKNFKLSKIFQKDSIINLDIVCDRYVIPFNVSPTSMDSINLTWQFKKKSNIKIWSLIKIENQYKLRITEDK